MIYQHSSFFIFSPELKVNIVNNSVINICSPNLATRNYSQLLGIRDKSRGPGNMSSWGSSFGGVNPTWSSCLHPWRKQSLILYMENLADERSNYAFIGREHAKMSATKTDIHRYTDLCILFCTSMKIIIAMIC